MREYSMDYPALLKLPLKTFWSLNKQINRLRAEQDHRTLKVMAGAQSSDGFKETAKLLSEEVDRPVSIKKAFDEDQFVKLQNRLKGKVTG